MSVTACAISGVELETSMAEVFEIMFFRTLDLMNGSRDFPGPALMVTAYFEGDSSGFCQLVIKGEEAATLAHDFLAAHTGEFTGEAEVVNVLCEMGNMLCGHVLSRNQPDSLFRILPPVCSTLGAHGELPGGEWSRFGFDEGQVAARFVFRSMDVQSRIPAASLSPKEWSA